MRERWTERERFESEVIAMMYWNHGHAGAGGWLVMGLMMVVFWGALIAFVVWLVRTLRPEHRADVTTSRSSRADEVLAERYARGEIDDDEYKRRRQVMHGS